MYINHEQFIEAFGFNPITEWTFLGAKENWQYDVSGSGSDADCIILNASGEHMGHLDITTAPSYVAAETKRRWKKGDFIESGHRAFQIPTYKSEDLIPYEDYMLALPTCNVWESGRVFVFFPPEGAEDNHLHTHPISDRIITVAQGSGWFFCVRDSRLWKYPLTPGTRVWMPRGKLHTFFAGPDGLVVESLHNPYVPVSHPQCLFTPAPEKLHYDLNVAAEGEVAPFANAPLKKVAEFSHQNFLAEKEARNAH